MSQNSAVQTQVNLISYLYKEIDERTEYPPALAEKASVVDEKLVTTVGQINLLASDDDRIVFQETLWPKVRRSLAVRSPGRFTHHCYDGLVASTLELANCPQPPQAHDIRSILRRRYDTGCLLDGLVVLWTDQGADAARFLWHQQGIAKWDEAIRQLIVRPDIAGIVRDWSATVLGLSSCSWFGVLRETTHLSASALADPSAGIVVRCPLRLRLLAEMMIEQYQDEFPTLRGCEIYTGDNKRTSVIWTFTAEVDLVGIWCPASANDRLELTSDDRKRTSALILAKEVERFCTNEDDEDGEGGFGEVWQPIRLCPELELTGYVSVDELPATADGESLQLSQREFTQLSMEEILRRLS